MADILVVGSANVDLLLWADERPANDGSIWTNRPAHVSHGGHAANCAHDLAVLGASVALLAAVGTDRDGDGLVGSLAEIGVDVSPVVRVAGRPTGRVVIPTLGAERFMIMDRGANGALDGEALLSALGTVRPRVLVVFDPPRTLFEVAMTIPLPGTVRFAVPGGQLAKERRVAQALVAADWVVVNRPERLDLETHLRGLSRRPDLRLVTTMGEGGARVEADGAGTTVLPPVAVSNVIDATGAGDAFVAGLVDAVLRGCDTAEALMRGNEVAARVLGTEGARLAVGTA